MRRPALPFRTISRSTLVALAVVAAALVACDLDPFAPAAATPAAIAGAPKITPALAFTIREVTPNLSLATSTAPRDSWPHDPGSAAPPVLLEVITRSNAVRLRPLLRLGLGTPSVLALDAAGDRLAVGTRTGLVSVYTVPTGTALQRWQAADREVLALAFTGDGRHLIVAGAGGRISIWNPASVSSIATFDTGIRNPHRVVLASDAVAAAILSLNPAANRSEISIWDPITGALLRRHSSPIPVTALDISPDGAYFAIGGTDGAVEILSVSGGGPSSVESLHEGFLHAVSVVGGDGPRYISAGAGPVGLHGYDLSPGLSGWDAATRTAAIATSRDGRIVLTGDFAGGVTLANLNERSIVRISGLHRDRIVALALDRSGAHAATAGLDGTVAIWPAADPTSPTLLTGYLPPTTGLIFSNNSTLVASHHGGSNSIWNTITATGAPPPSESATSPPTIASSPSASDTTLGLRAVGGPDGLVTVFQSDRESSPIVEFTTRAPITHLSFTSAGTLLIVDGDGFLHRADVSTGAITPIPSPAPGAIIAIAAQPDSAHAAVALISSDILGTLALLDLTDGQWTVIDRFPGCVVALAASDRFELIFVLQTSVNDPSLLALRDGQTGRLLAEFPTPSHRPLHIALSPDGRLRATAGAGAAIWLWGVPTD